MAAGARGGDNSPGTMELGLRGWRIVRVRSRAEKRRVARSEGGQGLQRRRRGAEGGGNRRGIGKTRVRG